MLISKLFLICSLHELCYNFVVFGTARTRNVGFISRICTFVGEVFSWKISAQAFVKSKLIKMKTVVIISGKLYLKYMYVYYVHIIPSFTKYFFDRPSSPYMINARITWSGSLLNKNLFLYVHFTHLLFPYPIKISFYSFPHPSTQIQVIKNAYQHFPWKLDTLHFILQFRMDLSPCSHLFSCWQRMLNSLFWVLTNILMLCFSNHFSSHFSSVLLL